MRYQNQTMENYNYHNDPRTRAQYKSKWFSTVDLKAMIATVIIYDADNDIEEEVTVPWKYEVCPTCKGKGKHVNPAIDCCGLTEDDFGADPDLYEAYQSSLYDVSCYGCEGKRVVPVLDRDKTDPQIVKLLDKREAEECAYEMMCASERAMGA